MSAATPTPVASGRAVQGVGPARHGPAVAVVDDDPGVLRSIARLLAVHGFVVFAYSSPDGLLAELCTRQPACIVADLSMPGLSGLDLQRQLENAGAEYPVVFVTGHGDIRTSVLAMRQGAVDFLTKPFDQADLLDAVDRAVERARGSRRYAQRVADFQARLDQLTKRELEVYQLVVTGRLNKQIAAQLGISEKTVKVHRARVMLKTGTKSVAELARAAEQLETHRAVRRTALGLLR